MSGDAPSLRIEPQPWMIEPATRNVVGALAEGGAEARFVGGSVRDALLGRPIGDIDMATPALPDRVIALLQNGDRPWHCHRDCGQPAAAFRDHHIAA